MGKLSGDGNRQANLGNARYVLQSNSRTRKELSNSVHRNGMDADTLTNFLCATVLLLLILSPNPLIRSRTDDIRFHVARPDIKEHSVGRSLLKRFLSQLKLWEALSVH